MGCDLDLRVHSVLSHENKTAHFKDIVKESVTPPYRGKNVLQFLHFALELMYLTLSLLYAN